METKSIEPKQINLKLLVPLIEYSSLEEDEEVQNIWANVIANIASSDTEQLFNLKCIETLKEITPNEIFCLDHLFNGFKEKEKSKLGKWKNNKFLKDNNSIHPSDFVFSAFDLAQELKLEREYIDLYIDRLISFGIIKFREAELHESSPQANVSDKHGKTSVIKLKSYELDSSDLIHFTHFGLYFVTLCKFNI